MRAGTEADERDALRRGGCSGRCCAGDDVLERLQLIAGHVRRDGLGERRDRGAEPREPILRVLGGGAGSGTIAQRGLADLGLDREEHRQAFAPLAVELRIEVVLVPQRSIGVRREVPVDLRQTIRVAADTREHIETWRARRLTGDLAHMVVALVELERQHEVLALVGLAPLAQQIHRLHRLARHDAGEREHRELTAGVVVAIDLRVLVRRHGIARRRDRAVDEPLEVVDLAVLGVGRVATREDGDEDLEQVVDGGHESLVRSGGVRSPSW